MAENLFEKGAIVSEVTARAARDGHGFHGSFNGSLVGSFAEDGLLIETGATMVFMEYSIVSDGKASIYLAEDTSRISASPQAPLFIANRNRDRANKISTDVLVERGPVATSPDTGTILSQNYVNPDHDYKSRLWVLKPNTNYVIIVTNLETDTRNFNLEVDWYQ